MNEEIRKRDEIIFHKPEITQFDNRLSKWYKFKYSLKIGNDKKEFIGEIKLEITDQYIARLNKQHNININREDDPIIVNALIYCAFNKISNNAKLGELSEQLEVEINEVASVINYCNIRELNYEMEKPMLLNL